MKFSQPLRLPFRDKALTALRASFPPLQLFNSSTLQLATVLAWVLIAGSLPSLAQPQFTLLEYTNEWKYLQGNATPTNWFASDFDDAAWPAGRGVFAVPINENVLSVAPVNTALSTNVGDGYIITYYFRTSFTLSSNSPNIIFRASAVIDDGAVFYINGREARRVAMPASDIAYNTLATRSDDISVHGIDTFTFASTNFVEGVNLIAIELHQGSLTSPDAVFGMRLVAEVHEPVAITQHPVDQTVEVGHTATFSVTATGTDLRYRWFRNNLALAGATNSSFTTGPATMTANGQTFFVVVSNSLNSVTSTMARLTVVPDQSGPDVLYAVVELTNRITIRFDEVLLRSPATNIPNYSVSVLGTTNQILITNAFYGVNQVRLHLNQNLNPTSNYVLCIRNVADNYTNVIAPNPTCLGVGFPITSNLVSLGEVWRYNEVSIPPTNWVELNYRDDHPEFPPYEWAEGRAAFAYSLSPTFTPCSAINTWLWIGRQTYYFRKRFFLTGEYPADAVANLRFMVDDGAVFYLNGAEIFRFNMPGGPIIHTTSAIVAVPDVACDEVHLPIFGRFVQGLNVLAVEVHQFSGEMLNPDVAFDAELSLMFRRAPIIPELHVTPTETNAVLSWDGVGWSLETAESISGPWSRIPTSGNQFVSPFEAPTGRRFFRLANP